MTTKPSSFGGTKVCGSILPVNYQILEIKILGGLRKFESKKLKANTVDYITLISVNDPFVMTTRSTFMFLQMVMHIISMHWIWKCKVHQPHYFCVTSVLDSSFFLKSSTSIMNENLCICCCG
ncbi:uncharacterized protein LOC131859854 isoform X1 [Cryptomeria japonica]|uniref:uncharacterized protein LOC131859854 isoform X1 n=1 Tax=Cryptomeria japonica TaxID=3369 RepID=UPI0027DAABA6|nr:uncharacterized protein LOC131859854 isoform X1 [Cryptomeria japonica]